MVDQINTIDMEDGILNIENINVDLLNGSGIDLDFSSAVNQNTFDIKSHNGVDGGLKLAGVLVQSSATEINHIAGGTPGTATADKVLIVDSNKDISGIRNIGVDEIDTTVLKINNTQLLSTPSELNKLHLNTFGIAVSDNYLSTDVSNQLDMNGGRIFNVQAPSASDDVTSKSYVDTLVSSVDVTATYASTTYVDSVLSGLDVKNSVVVASTDTISVSTPGYVIDGITLVLNDRILLKDQLYPVENGIYKYNGPWTLLSRTSDADSNTNVTSGMFTFIEKGNVNRNTGWVLTSTSIDVNITDLDFSKFSGAELPSYILNITEGIVTNSKVIVADTNNNVDMNGGTITNISTPTQPTDIMDKQTVDAGINSILFKNSVDVATTVPINMNVPGGTMDGYTLISGDRVMVKDQPTASENGIYNFTTSTQSLTRTSDFNNSEQIQKGSFVYIKNGTEYSNTLWNFFPSFNFVLDSTFISFTNMVCYDDLYLLKDITPGIVDATKVVTSDFNKNIDMNNGKITNISAPVNDSDVANKEYVDSVAQGLDIKESVRVTTTVNINLSSPGGVIDNINLNTGDRVLVKDQTNKAENGIYIWDTPTTAMVRAVDFDTATAGTFTFIEEGDLSRASGWVVTTTNVIIIGTTNIEFTKFSSSQNELNAINLILNATPGVAEADKALILDSNKDISVVGTIGANVLNATTVTATTLSGTLQTASQPNITEIGDVENLTVNDTLTTQNIILDTVALLSTAPELNLLNTVVPGVAYSNKALVAGPTYIDMSGMSIKNISVPFDPTDAVNKQYVDTLSAGFDLKQSVVACPNGNIDLTTPAPLFDTIAVSNGDRVLLKDQTDASENGVYIYGFPMTRSLDANTDAAVTPGLLVFVERGPTYENTSWVLVSEVSIVLGTTPLLFNKFISLVGARFLEVTPGIVEINKALVLGPNGDIATIPSMEITTLTSQNITGELQTGAQPNITNVGELNGLNIALNNDLNIKTHDGILNGLKLNNQLVKSNATELNYLHNTTPGVVTSSTAVIVDASNNVDFNNGIIKNLSTPIDSKDAVTKQYVDNLVHGIKVLAPVNVATTDPINISASVDLFDTITVVNGDRILVKDQSNPAENGVYVFNGLNNALTRSTDFDENEEINVNVTVIVENGVASGNTIWLVTTPSPPIDINLGSPILFLRFPTPVEKRAGNGLIETSLEFNVVGTGGILVNTNDIRAQPDNVTLELSDNTSAGVIKAKIGSIVTGNTGLATGGDIHDFVQDATLDLNNKTINSPIINNPVVTGLNVDSFEFRTRNKINFAYHRPLYGDSRDIYENVVRDLFRIEHSSTAGLNATMSLKIYGSMSVLPNYAWAYREVILSYNLDNPYSINEGKTLVLEHKYEKDSGLKISKMTFDYFYVGTSLVVRIYNETSGVYPITYDYDVDIISNNIDAITVVPVDLI